MAAALPLLDVVLLGVGEDGHVASVFPGHPAADETRTVTAVHDSPKPPPVRVTLSLPAINTARQVWLLAAGGGKAHAVRRALAPSPVPPGPLSAPVPAARVHGIDRTLWLLDRAVACHCVPSLDTKEGEDLATESLRRVDLGSDPR